MSYNSNVVYSIFRKLAMHLASIYKDYVYPARFEEVFMLGGVRIHIIAERAESEEDTKPFGRDEDEAIAD